MTETSPIASPAWSSAASPAAVTGPVGPPPGAATVAWQALAAEIEHLGREEFALRAENARRILREHGVTCGAAGDARTPEQPWELDCVPLVLGAEEWQAIEAGIIQRAHLLNQLLRDLYGTQRLLRDGFLPAPLIYANPAYLRACQAVPPPGGNYLLTCAVDLARGADGQWWVIADRTQAPTGMGFALENRTVVSRVLPELVQALQPRPLSTVLPARRDSLLRLAPRHPDNPAVVLLTPGPRSEAYFEHAYLARLMGFTLVEGGDLTVRDRAVFIKTLDGLQPADVILRRVTDAFCDPLELRADSLLGVPGLVEATRAGNVAVANALGSGLLESPAFLPFLPGLCRHLLGEELRLPAIATWWCGQGPELQHVLAHADTLALRSAFLLGDTPVRLAQLPAARRAERLAALHARPHEFVGQQPLQLAGVPALADGQWTRRPVVLRVFAMFDGERYVVMPGGFARVVSDPELASVALGPAGGSKDVWVLGADAHRDEPVQIAAPLSLAGRAALSLPSRTADNFFWLGRYTERLEHLARVTRSILGRLTEGFGPTTEARITALDQLLAGLGWTGNATRPPRPRAALAADVLALLRDPARPGGAPELFQRIHLAAFSVRDRLSADTWRLLNRLEPETRFGAGHLPLVQAASTLNALILNLAAFSGMEMENMTRGQGWTFLDAGRRLERGMNLLELLRAALAAGPHLDLLLEPVLEISDSVMTHRRRYFADLRPQTVLELLLTDRANPRSLAFQLIRLAAHATALPPGVNPAGARQVQRTFEALRTAAPDAPRVRACAPGDLLPLLEPLAAGLTEASDLLTQVYFSHTVPRVN
jgi:uncharacterized circularly permuted ATP-grasp superfamily protein/uncharacterized alpha-E superfamily protein